MSHPLATEGNARELIRRLKKAEKEHAYQFLGEYDKGFIDALRWMLGDIKCPYSWDVSKELNPSRR
jgi:hypothetical protein